MKNKSEGPSNFEDELNYDKYKVKLFYNSDDITTAVYNELYTIAVRNRLGKKCTVMKMTLLKLGKSIWHNIISIQHI